MIIIGRKMKSSYMKKIGILSFLFGFILILISWHFSYPIQISDVNTITFFQFSFFLWPGISISIIGLFLLAYFSKNKIFGAFCCSLFAILLAITGFFYSYSASSDCGAARAMFQAFQNTGIEPQIIPYFEFPTYFSLNEIIHQTIGFNEKGIAFISTILYGILLGLFLFLFFFNLKKQQYPKLLPFLLVIIYFIGMFSFLNYQWVPQTLALVYFFLLIFISTYLLSDPLKIQWKFMLILIFISLVFTHAIIPVLFLSVFGIITLKRRFLSQIFIAITSIYLLVTLYYVTVHLNLYIITFRQSIKGFGEEYVDVVSSSFKEPGGIVDQLISISNRIRVPLVWIISSIGTLILFLRKEIKLFLIALGLSGVIYLAIGIFYSILGLRAAQIMFIPMTIGFMFFVYKWKKPTIVLVVIILILAVFGPMRTAYDNTQFQLDEEANACNFLANNIINKTVSNVAVGQVNYGYFKYKYMYLKKTMPIAIRPGTLGFLNVFNESMSQNEYILYNSNLGKEILLYLMTKEDFNNKLKEIMSNNKIYDCNNMYIIKGVN